MGRAEVGPARATGTDRWQLPVRVSALPGVPSGSPMPLLAGLELVQQVGTILARQCLDVPDDHHLSVLQIAFRWTGRPLRLPHTGTTGATAFVQLHSRRERHGVTSAFEASLALRVGSVEIAHGSGAARCIDPAVFAAARGEAPPLGVMPERHDSDTLIVLQQRGHRLLGRIGWDADDPAQVDPGLDRLSGRALVAVALRAAERLCPQRPAAGVSMSIDRFVEYSPRPDVYATATDDSVEISVLQNRDVVAHGVVHLGR